jgi:hypothetical protein
MAYVWIAGVILAQLSLIVGLASFSQPTKIYFEGGYI